MKQRGIAQGWLYLIGLIVVLGLVYGIFHVVTGYLADVDAKGYQRGADETRAAYAKRDNEQLKAALAKVQELEAAARAAEQKHAKELAALDRQRRQEEQDAKRQHERDVAAVRAGTLRLRDRGATSCPAVSGQRPGPEAGAAASKRDAEAGTQLSDQAAEFLLGLTSEADDIARQLATAQALIESQIRTCNSP